MYGSFHDFGRSLLLVATVYDSYDSLREVDERQTCYAVAVESGRCTSVAILADALNERYLREQRQALLLRKLLAAFLAEDVILVIDINGAINIKKIIPSALFIFIMPPDMETLKNRLIGRKKTPILCISVCLS